MCGIGHRRGNVKARPHMLAREIQLHVLAATVRTRTVHAYSIHIRLSYLRSIAKHTVNGVVIWLFSCQTST